MTEKGLLMLVAFISCLIGLIVLANCKDNWIQAEKGNVHVNIGYGVNGRYFQGWVSPDKVMEIINKYEVK